jgi:CDP-glucose 4,6-dehydratase
MFGGQFANKKVWLSGHTGFKGSWLAAWLLELGARVHGFSLEPPTTPSLFEQLGLASEVEHEIGDIRDRNALGKSILSARPDYVFHLAAQPLVRLSYQEPVATYETNVMGTVHVLEALRSLRQPCAAVFVTTDKCYLNLGVPHAYREEDALGGHDPYSSSKAAAEIAIAAWRSSFFDPRSTGILPVGQTGFQPVPEQRLADETPTGPTGKMPVLPQVKIASARAGNVIGGGDWAPDRIVPDAIRSLGHGEPIPIRNKSATRPWQHVLEPLSGYLWLAAVLASPGLRPQNSAAELSSAFNFGPTLESNRTVRELIEEVLKHWPGSWLDRHQHGAPHEAELLNLATDKADNLLGWRSVWNFEQAVAATMHWYRSTAAKNHAAERTREQISAYTEHARNLGMAWARNRS